MAYQTAAIPMTLSVHQGH